MSKTTNVYSDKKIVWFPEKLESFVQGKITAPIYVRIKPINRCNHDCFWCIYRSSLSDMHEDMKEKDVIPQDKLRETILDLGKIGTKAVTFSGGGEPLLYKNIDQYMQLCLDLGINLSIITNAQLLHKKNAEVLGKGSWVRVSMDYFDAASMREARDIPEKFYQPVLDNIANFAATKNKSCDLSVNYIITQKNADHLFEITEILKELKIDNVRFSPVWLIDFHNYHEPIKNKVQEDLKKIKAQYDSPEFKIYDSYGQVNDQYISKRKYPKCYFNQVVPVVGADMKIYTCHNQAYSNDSVVASIEKQSFAQAWFSEETQKFFDEFNCQNTCTNQCAADKKNEFITELLEANGDNYV